MLTATDIHAHNAVTLFGIAETAVRKPHPQYPTHTYRDIAKRIMFAKKYSVQATTVAQSLGIPESLINEWWPKVEVM